MNEQRRTIKKWNKYSTMCVCVCRVCGLCVIGYASLGLLLTNDLQGKAPAAAPLNQDYFYHDKY